jgi:hypothetical protein
VISYSGRSKVDVLVCGMASFSKAIRGLVLEAMASYSDVEFAEVEYQPREGRGGHMHSGVGSLKTRVTEREVEMGVIDEMQRRRQLLTKSNPNRATDSSTSRSAGSRTATRLATVQEEEVSDISSSTGAGVTGREFV